jgi:hypothetical protein
MGAAAKRRDKRKAAKEAAKVRHQPLHPTIVPAQRAHNETLNPKKP